MQLQTVLHQFIFRSLLPPTLLSIQVICSGFPACLLWHLAISRNCCVPSRKELAVRRLTRAHILWGLILNVVFRSLKLTATLPIRS
ncbi:hypothetical protein B0H12DRAFT_1143427 [Mycena haematopus]|nr:hypothetical protein B0H12DRAFT_1143427 [Mycena haematopus]